MPLVDIDLDDDIYLTDSDSENGHTETKKHLIAEVSSESSTEEIKEVESEKEMWVEVEVMHCTSPANVCNVFTLSCAFFQMEEETEESSEDSTCTTTPPSSKRASSSATPSLTNIINQRW